MTDIRPYFRYAMTAFRTPGIIFTCCLFVLTVSLMVALAAFDYKTNFFATRLGNLLVSTNRFRPEVGPVWQRIQAHARSRAIIKENETLSFTDIQKGLPDPIRQNRFESEIIPETGEPGYVAIWKTPTPNININDRLLNDIITSRRTFQRGLEIMNALALPDIHFHSRVRERVDHLYEQFQDLDAGASDALAIVEGDTLEALTPDSLKAAVFNELAAVMIPALRETEKSTLIRDYQDGRVLQLFLYRELGRYRGEIYRDIAPETSIPFTIATVTVAQILELSQPDSSLTEPVSTP